MTAGSTKPAQAAAIQDNVLKSIQGDVQILFRKGNRDSKKLSYFPKVTRQVKSPKPHNDLHYLLYLHFRVLSSSPKRE